MSATITGLTTAATTSPLLIKPWRTSQNLRTIVHEIADAAEEWVTLAPADSREGTLVALYRTETLAEAARALLSTAQLFSITYPERPSLEITFAAVGRITVELQPNRRDWMVSFDFREVTA